MKTGQVVRLKTGGSLMAVVEIEDPGTGRQVADCVWFEDKAFVRGKFSAEALEPLPNPTIAGKAA